MTTRRGRRSANGKAQRSGLIPPKSRKKRAVATETDGWRLRIDKLFAADRQKAEKILQTCGFSAIAALGFVERLEGLGTTFQLKRGAPAEFRDPNNPAFYAVRLLALALLIEQADPKSLQVGRLWGRYLGGLDLPAIAKAVRDGHLAQHRGPGGSTQSDLGRTIATLVGENPQIDCAGILEYLQGDEAADRFLSTIKRTIFVTGIEYDQATGVVMHQLSFVFRTIFTHQDNAASQRTGLYDAMCS